jgi:signal transduction histidine kinase
MKQTSGATPGWRRVLFSAVDAASWRGLGYLSLGLLTGTVALALWITAVTVGLTFAVLVVGLPVALVCFVTIRAAADMERWRAAVVFGEPIARPYRPVSGGLLRRLLQRVSDPASWLDLAWLVLLFPLATTMAAVSWTLWAVGLGLVLLPFFYGFLPGGQAVFLNLDSQHHLVVDSFVSALLFAPLGIALCWVAGWTTRWMAFGQAWLARALLGPSQTAVLGRRVATLTETRAHAADAQTHELRRIERDLHDGAQARLAVLGADLGMAAEAFDSDPAAARALLDRARENAELALTELRELVRGVSPPILADRGLVGALDSLAARSPVPVRVTVDMTERAPPAVETAMYFVLAEALANVARHAVARVAMVDVRRTGDRVVVRVADDGRGGADPETGTGLTGLRERLAALDGTLWVSSPPGGPTVLIAEVPCGS